MVTVAPAARGLANVSRDQIVRLVAQHLDARQVEGPYRVSDQRNCGRKSSGGSGRCAL